MPIRHGPLRSIFSFWSTLLQAMRWPSGDQRAEKSDLSFTFASPLVWPENTSMTDRLYSSSLLLPMNRILLPSGDNRHVPARKPVGSLVSRRTSLVLGFTNKFPSLIVPVP